MYIMHRNTARSIGDSINNRRNSMLHSLCADEFSYIKHTQQDSDKREEEVKIAPKVPAYIVLQYTGNVEGQRFQSRCRQSANNAYQNRKNHQEIFIGDMLNSPLI